MKFKLNAKTPLKSGLTYCAFKGLSYEDIKPTLEIPDDSLMKVIREGTSFIVTRVHSSYSDSINFNWRKVDEPNVTRGSLVNSDFVGLLNQILEDFYAGQILIVRPDSIDAMTHTKGQAFRRFVGVRPFTILMIDYPTTRIRIQNHNNDQEWFFFKPNEMRFFNIESDNKKVKSSTERFLQKRGLHSDTDFTKFYVPNGYIKFDEKSMKENGERLQKIIDTVCNKSVDTKETPAIIERVTMTVSFSNEEEKRRVIKQIEGIKL